MPDTGHALTASAAASRLWRLALGVALALGATLSAARADTLTLVWDANSEPDLQGYVVWWGPGSGQYTNALDVGNQTWFSFPEPDPGVVLSFVVQAYNISGLASDFSAAVSTNVAPVASDGSWTTNENTPLPGVLGATDVNGDPLTFSLVSLPARGSLSLTNAATGAFTYTPALHASGDDSFAFRASDGALVSNTATVSITIVPLTVALAAPSGGDTLFVNVPSLIRWTTDGGATSVDVEVSGDGGGTFSPVPGCAGLPGSAVSCSWTPAGPTTTTARVRVTARTAGAGASSVSPDFTILARKPTIKVTAPAAHARWAVGTMQTVQWRHNLGVAAFVRIELSRNDGRTWEAIAAAVQNTASSSGAFSWVVTGPTTSRARFRVTWLGGPAADRSDRMAIVPGPLSGASQASRAPNRTRGPRIPLD